MMFKSLFKTGLTTLVVAAGLLSSAAFAHTDEYLDTVVGPNGGQLRMAGAYHFELVLVKDAKAARAAPEPAQRPRPRRNLQGLIDADFRGRKRGMTRHKPHPPCPCPKGSANWQQVCDASCTAPFPRPANPAIPFT